MRKLATLALTATLLGCPPVLAGQGPDAGVRSWTAPVPASLGLDGVTEGPPPAQSAACACSPAALERLGGGMVWQGAERLGLAEIAALAAPVLWFSADEPLLDVNAPAIPAAHPCDTPSDGPVVYYQVTRIAYHGSSPVTMPLERDPGLAEKVVGLVIRFFFYYPNDAGVGGHTHDLESIEVEIALGGEGTCRNVRITRVEGLAHGSRWYSNILEERPDTKFPITVLVEEGKHGSAPDRNADGHFMRGYDVTARVNDAWGVRDSLGQGVLLTPGYNPEMTKPRTDRYRLLPPENPRLCVSKRRSSIGDRPSLGRYTLRSAHALKQCEVPVAGKFLEEITKANKFGAPYQPQQFQTGDPRAELSRLDSPDQFLSFSLRNVAGRAGAAFVLRGFDLREGWLVPRLTVDKFTASGEMMFTRSASRWSDGYLSIGVLRQFDTISETQTIDTENGRQDVTIVVPPHWDGVLELGVKFRANIPSKLRPFVLGYHFGGFRFGMRAVGFPTVYRWQLTWEIGAGAWQGLRRALPSRQRPYLACDIIVSG